jgi:hypothetical protein
MGLSIFVPTRLPDHIWSSGFMKKHIVRLAGVFALLVAILIVWAHWTPSVQSILPPSTFRDEEINLTRDFLSGERQPILLLLDLADTNVYARYLGEILKAEGILSFEALDLSTTQLEKVNLDAYALIIADASTSRLSDQRERLAEYVASGGRLLVVAPPAMFDSLIGLRRNGVQAVDGRLLLNPDSGFLEGFPRASLQIFGAMALYDPNGAEILATLTTNARTEKNPAISIATYGRGLVGCMTYELGRSVVITRQGLPPAGHTAVAVDRDGDGVFKTSDLFYDTYDYANRNIPQADLQQRLLVKLIHRLLESKLRVPQVWYHPGANSAVALLTGDHHGWVSQSAFPAIASIMDSVHGHFSFFVYPDQVDSALVARLMKEGHAFEPHLYYPSSSNRLMRARLLLNHWGSSTYFFRPRFGDLESEINRGTSIFGHLNAGLANATRFHYLIWWGWTETAELLAAKGYRMDFSISGIDPHYAGRPSVVDRWNSPMGYGYVNGSGLPMQPITPAGTIVPIFMQLTQFEDDVVAREVVASPSNDSLTLSRLVSLSRQFTDASVDSLHTALVWNFHPEHTIQRWPPDAPMTTEWLRETTRYLRERGVPMLTVREWVAFNKARRRIRFEGVRFNPVTRAGNFSVVSAEKIRNLSIIIPGDTVTDVTLRTGVATDHPQILQRRINGSPCALITIDCEAGGVARIDYSVRK